MREKSAQGKREFSLRSFALLLSIFFLLFVGLAGTRAFAQGATDVGTLVGTVTDPSGAVVPSAKITLTHTGTGATRTTQSGARGLYTFAALPPGVYAVAVEAAGFARNERRVQIIAGSTASLDFKLTLGAAVTSVEVKGTMGVAVNIVSPTLETVITSSDIEELPTLTRNPYDLVSLAGIVSEDDPGAQGGTGSGAGVSINGLRASGTNVLLDGGANNDEFSGSIGQSVPLDSVREFTVLANNFGAQYGRATAGVVNVVTKSGTNAFHGTVYEFHRDSALDSNTFDNNAQGRGPDGKPVAPKPVFTRNQFGYSVGGPIKKDKLFFFSSTEWTRVRSAGTETFMVLDPAFISHAASNSKDFFKAYGTVRPGANTIRTLTFAQLAAAGADPCGASGPCRNLETSNPNLPVFDELGFQVPTDAGGGLPQNAYSMVHRVDWTIGPNTQFYARYALQNEIDFPGTVSTSPFAGFDTGVVTRNQNVLLGYTHAFSPAFITATKFVYNRLKLVDPINGPPTPTMFPSSVGGAILGVPLADPGYLPLTPGSGIPFGGPQNFAQAYEDVSWTKGAHDMKFGGSYVFLGDNRSFGAYEEASEILGKTLSSGMDNFLKGQLFNFLVAIDPQGKFPCHSQIVTDPTTGVQSIVPIVTPECSVQTPVTSPGFSRSNRYNELAAYFQDSWKMRSRLTINLGLRWEYFGVQHNKNPLLDSNYYDGPGAFPWDRIRAGAVALAPLSPVGGLWGKDWRDFAPRIGFAWDVFGDGKTSLRGGYGIAYERNYGNVTFNVIQNVPNYFVISTFASDVGGNLPVSVNNFSALGTPGFTKPLPKASLRQVSPNIKTAYAHLWGLTLERQLARNVVLGIDYSGSKGQRLYDLEFTSYNPPGSGVARNGDPCLDLDGDGVPDTGNPDACLPLRSRFDQYSTISNRGNRAFSIYNALNVRLNMANVRGVSLTANYTYSHAIDNLSQVFSAGFQDINSALLDPFHPALDRGSAEFDNRHRFTLGAMWDIPTTLGYRRTTGPWGRLLSGWEVLPIFTVRTGTPTTIYDCTNANLVCPRVMLNGPFPKAGPSNQAAPGLANTFVYIDYSKLPIDESFVNPSVGVSDFGPFPRDMTGRGVFVGPGAWFLNFAVHKTTSITERVKMQFRAELFNAFNHSNLYVHRELGLNDIAESPFLPAKRGVSEAASTFADFGLQERRNIQLALKLIF